MRNTMQAVCGRVVTKTEKVFVTEEKNMSELHLPYQALGGEQVL